MNQSFTHIQLKLTSKWNSQCKFHRYFRSAPESPENKNSARKLIISMHSHNTFSHNIFWPHGLAFIKFPRIENQNDISQVTWEWGIRHRAYKNIQLCFCSCRRLESPTRTLTLEAPKGVEVNAGVGEFRASCRKELTLESSEGEVSNLLVLVDRSCWIPLLLLRCQNFLSSSCYVLFNGNQ